MQERIEKSRYRLRGNGQPLGGLHVDHGIPANTANTGNAAPRPAGPWVSLSRIPPKLVGQITSWVAQDNELAR